MSHAQKKVLEVLHMSNIIRSKLDLRREMLASVEPFKFVLHRAKISEVFGSRKD